MSDPAAVSYLLDDEFRETTSWEQNFATTRSFLTESEHLRAFLNQVLVIYSKAETKSRRRRGGRHQ